MLALELGDDLVKGFMGRILKENIFDSFNVRSVDIVAKNRFSIDGELLGEIRGYLPWNEVQPLVYEIIKQMGKPQSLKIVLSYKEPSEVHVNASALFLNLMYENGKVTFTTATSQKEFSMDRSLNSAWDEWVRSFFGSIGTAVKDR